ncbi:MAG: ABC-F family ATP-binding cassette domain-containing protein, partial [Planctomycetales bacterium]|nr:ABC-F family ATP-binding cassette domain-containing protein [Planctomycetales bacterium]
MNALASGMALITLDDLTVGFRGPPLLDGVNCQIERGERIGLLGRNGAGKSTLMRIVAGELAPDHGACRLAPGCRVAQLPQEVPQDIAGAVGAVIAQAAAEAHVDDEAWRNAHHLERLLDEMDLREDQEFSTLSAGRKRRVLLARALATQPDALLLDEPTNHLDISSIEWLEKFLSRWPGTLLFVTH